MKPVVNRIKTLRLQREDFETLKIIGRGAFGEVRALEHDPSVVVCPSFLSQYGQMQLHTCLQEFIQLRGKR